jgi:O-antigen ligase
MMDRIKFRSIYFCFFLVYALSLLFFYNKYVPFVKSFQLVLAPVLLIIFLITSIRVDWGILLFVFAFILGNNLPYFFGIDGSIPHAPTSLIFFLFFFLGWLLHYTLFPSKLDFDHPVFRPLFLLSTIIFVSGIITFFRHANFFPISSDNINELVVNINGVRAGGAIMSDVFGCLSYLTGFLFFVILFNTIKSKDFVRKLLVVLSVAILISLIFSLVQKYYSISLGNTLFWVKQNRINATFKDPNSFGVILASVLPLLTGLFFSLRKNFRFFLLLLIALGLFAFALTGSRSGLLGLGASYLTFFLLCFFGYSANSKKKMKYGLSFLLIIGVLFFSFQFFLKRTNLYRRIGWSLDTIANKESIDTVFTHKLDFWAAGFNMIKDYPLTGVGVGAFIIELPNYLNKMGKTFRYTDSAENYFFHLGAELGLIGFLLALWMFYEIAKGIRKNWKRFQLRGRNKFILIGAISGIVSIFISFFFHSYIGSYEVKYFFWLMVLFVLFFQQDELTSISEKRYGAKFKIGAIILPIIFGMIFLWHSTHSLSIEIKTREFGWDQNFGLYQMEKDERGFFFHWAKKTAGIAEENLGPSLIIPIKASHPDIAKTPVKVKIYAANKYFKIKELLEEMVFRDSLWKNFVLDTSELPKKKIHLVFETNRVWQPLKDLGVPDPRQLAVKIGKTWFEYPSDVEANMIKDMQKISNDNWKGEFKEKLWRNGISEISFRTGHDNVALRLNLTTGTAFDLGPYIIIRIDGQVFGKCMLNFEGRTSFVLKPGIKKGDHVLSIEYANFIHDPKLNQYRFVYLGDLEIINVN